ncbi:MAG: hypothetical protein HDS03_04475 [Bacteroides sp.]|nr:hypothetical protein [Bacteroides sp.]
MKKVYAFAAASLVAGVFSASAAEFKVNRNNAELSSNASEKMCAVPGIEHKTNDRVETRADEWKALGEGMFREFIFSSLYRGLDAYELPVEVEESTTEPNYYRLVNMYRDYVTEVFGGEMYTYDATSTTYLYIKTFDVDGKTYWYMPEDANLGFYVEPETSLTPGNATLHFNLSTLIANYDPQTIFDVYPGAFGTYEDGIFTIPAKFTTENGEFPVLFWSTSGMEEGYGIACNTKKQFALALPGHDLPAPPDPFASYQLVGECDMQNNFLDNFFSEWGTPQGKVTVYEEEDNKGYFHIKNAYVAGGWNNSEVAAEIDLEINLTNPNYGKLPEQSTGYFDDVDGFGTVEIMSASMVYTAYIQNTITDQEFLTNPNYAGMNVYIDPATKRIILPGLAIRYFFPDLPQTSEYYNTILAAPEGAKESWIQLPSDYILPEAGVNSVCVDDSNAPVKYFNLQGMEVANPEAGQLVIKKQGSKTSKFIVK